MPMSITVNKGQPSPADVFHDTTAHAVTLVIGEYRYSVDAKDPRDLIDGALVLDRLQAVLPAVRRDIEAALTRHKRAEQERVRAAAGLTAQPTCSCGTPDMPQMVHRLDLPCHAESITPCFTCQGGGCPECVGTGNQDVVARASTPVHLVRETTHAVRPYVPAVTPISTPTRAASAPPLQPRECGCSEHGPCPAHGGPAPGEETRDLTSVMPRPAQPAATPREER
ncbi:hypothetical protein ABT158_48685 [Nonomuraea sp. NPDC001636]|uniref:hypothetical protein n=1 Tax=Nonomuraea sp. NPDC001636 TaxID=3154391 RepID=UPI003320AA3E